MSCSPGLTRCRDVCTDLLTDLANCGACGRICADGTLCRGGSCVSPCPPGLAACGAACVSLRTDVRHCGRCNNPCPTSLRCVDGMCIDALMCSVGETLCAGRCVDPRFDPANCGGCGRVCAPEQLCAMGRCTPAPTGRTLRIEALLTSGCRVADHTQATGDDRGGIAFAGARVFYTGDDRTAVFDAESLSVLALAPRRLDGIFGEVTRGLPFTLASNLTPFDESSSILDALLQVSPDGTPGRTAIPLSATAFLDRTLNDVGIFAGALRVVVTQGTRAWVIDGRESLAAPRVTALTIPPIGAHARCESWAFWGVLESFEGESWVAYVRDRRSIVRQHLTNGSIEVIAEFPERGLGDMCSFTVAPMRNRWYFHHEEPSFARNEAGETLGYCDARITTQ